MDLYKDNNEDLLIKPIAHIRTDFPEKFGVPRQGGLVSGLTGKIEFTDEFKDINMIREIEAFSHLWIIWGFSENEGRWTPTVRPPRLGGNKRVGVFASRSPFRPNPIGLSVVKIIKVVGTDIYVSGIDMTDNTPIYDIKPYIHYTDAVEGANDGFALATKEGTLSVKITEESLGRIPEDKQKALIEVLSQDPRPQYQNDTEREYKMSFAGFTVVFRVCDDILEVTDIK